MDIKATKVHLLESNQGHCRYMVSVHHYQDEVMMNPVCVQLLPGEEHVCLLPEHPAPKVGTLRLRPAPADPQHTV